MYYWVFKHRLVNESASMDISLHPHAVRVMKTDDIPISLQQAARQHLIDVECVRVSQKELREAQEKIDELTKCIVKLALTYIK